jgi:hypothetical protein
VRWTGTLRGASGQGQLVKSYLVFKGAPLAAEKEPRKTETLSCLFTVVGDELHWIEWQEKGERKLYKFSRKKPG